MHGAAGAVHRRIMPLRGISMGRYGGGAAEPRAARAARLKSSRRWSMIDRGQRPGATMRTTYFPSTDAGLLEWSRNFSARLNLAWATYGISQQQAEAYALVHADYAAAYAAAVDPVTRTRGQVARKNDERKRLKAEARTLVAIIQAHPPVTAQQKIALGLTVRKDRATRLAAPAEPPGVTILSVLGGTIRLRLEEKSTGRRARPRGVAGASIFIHAGETPPADLAEWCFQQHATRTSVQIHLGPAMPPGSKVWICAFWFNARSQRGPLSDPVSTYAGGGVRLSA